MQGERFRITDQLMSEMLFGDSRYDTRNVDDGRIHYEACDLSTGVAGMLRRDDPQGGIQSLEQTRGGIHY